MAKTDPDKRPWAATRQGLAEALGQIDGLLPGSVAVRHMRCGKLGCACKADPPTLPLHPVDPHREGQDRDPVPEPRRARPLPVVVRHAQRLSELVAKLEIASVHALDADQRLPHTTIAKRTARGSRP